MLKVLTFCCFLLFGCVAALGQEVVSGYLKIVSITVEGHRKTKVNIVLRELDFKAGDSILWSDIQLRFLRNRQRLMNSTLFSAAELDLGKVDTLHATAEVVVRVEERTYLSPFGWISVADRNFNVWFFEKKRDLRRLNYQVGLNWNNFLGYRDVLKLSADFGFGNKYELNYSIPGVNRRKTIGFYLNALYSKNKEVWFATTRDSLRFFRDDSEPQIYRTRLMGGLTYRPFHRTTYGIQLSYFHNEVSERVARTLNPYFFLDTLTEQRYFSLLAKMVSDLRDNRYYPRKGHFLSLSVQKDGVFSKRENVQALYVVFFLARYLPVYRDKIDYEGIFRTRVEMTGKEQPYFNSRALGYNNDYLRGYEYFVIDGPNYAYLKNAFRFDLWKKDIRFGRFVPASLRVLPTHLWLCLNNDFGYVPPTGSGSENTFPGRFLWGRGIGMNLLFYNSNLIQFEISQNHLRKWGWYFHYVVPLE